MIFRRRRLMELSQASTRDLVNAPIGNPEDHSEVNDVDDQEDFIKDLRDEIEAIENGAIDEPPDDDIEEPPDDNANDEASGPPKKKYKFRDRKCVTMLLTDSLLSQFLGFILEHSICSTISSLFFKITPYVIPVFSPL